MHKPPLPSGIGIADAAYFLPGEAQDVSSWAEQRQVAPKIVEQLLENGCRHFHESAAHSDADMIGMAIDSMLARDASWLPQVRYLVHTHTQNFSMPAPPSSILSDLITRYDMQPALTFSIGHVACAGVINAIAWAERLLLEDPAARYALVVTSDRVFGGAKYRLRPPGSIQSDGASAILLSKDKLRCRLGRIDLLNAAELHDGPSSVGNIANIGRLTWKHTQQLFQQHSAASGIALDQYDRILPINADRDYWGLIAKGLKLDPAKFYFDNIPRRGHACCADLAINLVDCGFDLLEQGQSLLACGQSNVGAHAALTLLPALTHVAPCSTPDLEFAPCV